MANPKVFKGLELAMRVSDHLDRYKSGKNKGKLKTGKETVTGRDGIEREVAVVYGIDKDGNKKPLRNVMADIFVRNDVEGQKKEAYPALRYSKDGPQQQWYSTAELLSFEEKWDTTKVKNNNKETTFLTGKGNVFPANGNNRTEGFKVNHKSLEPSEVPFDATSHYDNTAITREQYKEARKLKAAEKAANDVGATNAPEVPKAPQTQTEAEVEMSA